MKTHRAHQHSGLPWNRSSRSTWPRGTKGEGHVPLFLITAVCDEGVSATSFKVAEAESPLAIAQHILDHPYAWERLLRHTTLWWELTYYPYKYGEPRGWTAADLLSQIDSTHEDGDSTYQFRIH